MLAVHRFGTGSPLVALHGFTLSGAQFARGASLLNRTVIAPDLPGHGDSSDQPTAWGDAVSAVTAVIAASGGSVPVLGYSQGGRLALACAIDGPESVSALILVSANAGIEEPIERKARAEADIGLAAKIVSGPIETFIDEWTASGITSTAGLDPKTAADDRQIRLRNTPHGLAGALRGYGQGAQPPMWDSLDQLTMPVLVLSGSNDTKYTAIASRMVSLIPAAEQIVIDGAGHNPLLTAPETSYSAISSFLDRRG